MDKWFLKSKTIIGAIVAALPGFSQAFGLEISAGEVAEAGSRLATMLDSLQAVAGFVLIWWGRNTAAGSVTLLPKL